MSIGGALQIGKSGLLASQAAIEVAGHNLSNVSTRGYHRQVISLAPSGSQQVQRGIFVGRGVQIQNIVRQVDESLENRIRSSVSDQAGSLARQDLLKQIESLHNELSDSDLSSQLNQFFNAWSELANRPLDNSVRTVTMQEGQTLASMVRNLRENLSKLRTQLDDSLDASVRSLNDTLSRLEEINQQIAKSERGGGGANSLRDQRDQLLAEISQFIDVSTVEQPNGSVDVFVGSLPIVLNGQSRGVKLERKTVEGELQINVVLGDDNSRLSATSGKIGSLITARNEDVLPAIEQLDDFAKHLIHEVNRVHSQGQGTTGFTSVTAGNAVNSPLAALGETVSGLTVPVGHGSFEIHVTQKSTGQRVTHQVRVDADGLAGNGITTLATLSSDLDALAQVKSSISGDNRLIIATENPDYEISFGTDTSGALASLGINTFFQGSNASDMDVTALVKASPSRIAAAQGHVPGDNRNALAIAQLRTQGLDSLNGRSLAETWSVHVEDYAVRLGQTNQQVEADQLVGQSLSAQQQAISGVNTDEEAINLLSYQRAYQASARFLSTVDEMMQTLLSLI